MIFQADIWFIENVFEKFSHWWQKTVSYKQDCFWWSLVVYIYSIIPMLFGGIISLIPGYEFGPNRASLFFITAILCFFLAPYAYLIIKEIKEKTYKMLSLGASNALKGLPTSQIFRAMYVSMATLLYMLAFVDLFVQQFPYSIGTFLLASSACSIVAAVYFSSCDPLPPSNEKSRLQKWAASVCEKMTPSPSPVPASA